MKDIRSRYYAKLNIISTPATPHHNTNLLKNNNFTLFSPYAIKQNNEADLNNAEQNSISLITPK